MKNIARIIIPVIVSIICCIGLLFLSSLIPKQAIEKKCQESASYYMSRELFDNVLDGYFFARQDNYADCILNNVVYNVDEKHPVVSSLKASYYSPEMKNVNESFEIAVSGENITDKDEAMVDYYRYWHGSMVLLRPLFLFFNIVQIRMILGALAIIGVLISAFLLWIQKRKAVAVCYLLSMVAVDIWMLCFCIEYVTTFLVLDGVILVLLNKLRKEKTVSESGILSLFAISGVVTAFVDFLTTETITYTIPAFILIISLFETGKISKCKETFVFLLKTGMSWAAGYGLMFLLKWVISAVLFGKTAFFNSLSSAAVRISGEVTLGNTNLDPVASKSQQLFGAIWHNLGCLYHNKDTMKEGPIFLITFFILLIVFALIYLFHTTKVEGAFLLLSGALFLLPFLRYLVLSNHAYLHYFFTYRALAVSILVLCYFLWEYALKGIIEMLHHKPKKKKRT